MSITLTYHGHSCFQIENETLSLLIDPFFTDNPVATIPATEVQCTHIAVTHGHMDHLGDCVEIAKSNKAPVFATYEICEYVQEQGHALCEPGNTGGRIESAFGSISFTQALHSSSFQGRYMGMPCGFMIEFEDLVIYHAGDTALFSDMELLGQIYQPDISILPIGDRFTMGPQMAAVAAEMVGAATTIPMHFNTWSQIEVDASQFSPEDIDVLVMQPGDTVEITI